MWKRHTNIEDLPLEIQFCTLRTVTNFPYYDKILLYYLFHWFYWHCWISAYLFYMFYLWGITILFNDYYKKISNSEQRTCNYTTLGHNKKGFFGVFSRLICIGFFFSLLYTRSDVIKSRYYTQYSCWSDKAFSWRIWTWGTQLPSRLGTPHNRQGWIVHELDWQCYFFQCISVLCYDIDE